MSDYFSKTPYIMKNGNDTESRPQAKDFPQAKNHRDSFVFYRSFFEMIDKADTETQVKVYRAIAAYALDKIEPNEDELGLIGEIIWKGIKPQLDANWKRFLSGCNGGKFGNLGGAPKGNKNAQKQPQNNPKTTPNVNVNVNVNDNVNDNVDIYATSATNAANVCVSPNKVIKHKYGNYHHVLLSDTERNQLNADFGEELTNEAIAYLDEYIEMKGYKAKSHNLALRKWVFDAMKNDKIKMANTRTTPQDNWDATSFMNL